MTPAHAPFTHPYIGEHGPQGGSHSGWPNVGPRVSIHMLKGEVLVRLGTTPGGFLPGQFTTPHGIAVDSQGNIYVGELSGRYWPHFSKDPVPEKRRVIHRRARSPRS